MTRLRLPCTWRLGPHTTAVIQPAFYADLPFTSAHPPRHVEVHGTALPEIGVEPVKPLAGPGDPCLAAATAARVRDLLRSGVVVEASAGARGIEPHDFDTLDWALPHFR